MDGTAPTSAPIPSSTPSSQSSSASQGQPAVPQTSSQTKSTSSPQSPSTPTELFEVKIDGKVQKMTREELISHAQMAKAAHSRFQEASQKEKAVRAIIDNAKSNPIQALMDPTLGLSKEQIRHAFEDWYKQEFIDPETLPPEQLRNRQLERELERYKNAEREQQEKIRKENIDRMTAQQRDYYSNQIIQAIDQSGLPKTAHTAERMAFYMHQNLINGWEAPMDLIVSQVKNEYKDRFSTTAKESTVEQLIELLGEENINKIRQYDLKKLREGRTKASGVNQDTRDRTSRNTSSGRLSSADVTQRLNEIRLGKRVF